MMSWEYEYVLNHTYNEAYAWSQGCPLLLHHSKKGWSLTTSCGADNMGIDMKLTHIHGCNMSKQHMYIYISHIGFNN